MVGSGEGGGDVPGDPLQLLSLLWIDEDLRESEASRCLADEARLNGRWSSEKVPDWFPIHIEKGIDEHLFSRWTAREDCSQILRGHVGLFPVCGYSSRKGGVTPYLLLFVIFVKYLPLLVCLDFTLF